MADAILTYNDALGVYDFALDADGQIDLTDSYDTALLYSFYGERRATQDEEVNPARRRGWIGNSPDFENGSKLWLYEQPRKTRETINAIKDEAKKAFQWMVDDRIAVSIDDPIVTISARAIAVEVTIRRSRDEVIRRNFILWENTGRAA